MRRNKLYRLYQLNRIIKKRKNIVKNIWRPLCLHGYEEENILLQESHRMHKWNLNCGSKMCHYYKYLGNSKHRWKYKDLKAMAILDDREID